MIQASRANGNAVRSVQWANGEVGIYSRRRYQKKKTNFDILKQGLVTSEQARNQGFAMPPSMGRNQLDELSRKALKASRANQIHRLLIVSNHEGKAESYGFLTRGEAAEILYSMGIYPTASQFDREFQREQRQPAKMESSNPLYKMQKRIEDSVEIDDIFSTATERSGKKFSLVDPDNIFDQDEMILEINGIDVPAALDSPGMTFSPVLDPSAGVSPDAISIDPHGGQSISGGVIATFMDMMVQDYGMAPDEVYSMIEEGDVTQGEILDAFRLNGRGNDGELIGQRGSEEPTEMEIKMQRIIGDRTDGIGEWNTLEDIENPIGTLRPTHSPDNPLIWNHHSIPAKDTEGWRAVGGEMVSSAMAAYNHAQSRMDGGLSWNDIQKRFRETFTEGQRIVLPSGIIGTIITDPIGHVKVEVEYLNSIGGETIIQPLPYWHRYWGGDFESLSLFQNIETGNPIYVPDSTIAGWNTAKMDRGSAHLDTEQDDYDYTDERQGFGNNTERLFEGGSIG